MIKMNNFHDSFDALSILSSSIPPKNLGYSRNLIEEHKIVKFSEIIKFGSAAIDYEVP